MASGSSLSSCLPCRGGESCSRFNLTTPDGGCNAGHFCLQNATYSSPVGELWGDICPIGHICPENSSQPMICSDGSFTNVTGSFECSVCPAGSYCVNGSSVLPCPHGFYCTEGTGLNWEPCPIGTYNPSVNVSALEGCLACPPGRFCKSLAVSTFDGVVAGDCAAGYFCLEGVNTSLPLPPHFTGTGGECPAGFYCPSATAYPLSCPVGTFSNQLRLTNVSECTPCTPGFYCAESNLTEPSGKCDAGFVCVLGAIIPNPSGVDSTGYPCPSRHYCPNGTSIPLQCNAGEYNPIEAQAECFSCPSGYYCPEGSLTFEDASCPLGYYCPVGTTHAFEFPCPAGSYGIYERLQSESDCILCDPGRYCLGGRSSPDGVCSAGWFCSRGAFSPEPYDFALLNLTDVFASVIDSCHCTNVSTGGQCQPGFYCPQGTDIPIPCPRGMYCSGYGLSAPSGDCLPGFYCLSGASEPNPTDAVSGYPCPVGHYCELGAMEPYMCPTGMYLNVTGASSLSQCIPCTAGSYCGSEGLAIPSGPCQAGFYCPEGSEIPNNATYSCNPGHMCPEGSATQQLCEGGTYQDETGSSACKTCPARFYCPFNFTEPLTGFLDCPPGFYCPPGTTSANEFGCLFGTYGTLENRLDASECFQCPGGRYCGEEGLSDPMGSGPCSAGFFCSSGAFIPNPTDDSTGNVCPTGNYCPEGTQTPSPCPAGTFMPNTGAEVLSDCFACTAGQYCDNTGLSSPTGPCEAGYFCTGGSSTPTPVDGIVGNTCNSGHFCPEGSNQSLPCLPGTYSSQPLASQCESCPAGHFCTDGLEPSICPQGYYCPTGTGFNLQACLQGTFSNQVGLEIEEQCTQCSAGHFCSELAARNVTGACEAGYFCTLGSSSPTPNGVKSTGNFGPCPIGHYCPIASQYPLPCPRGTFSNQTHVSNASECAPCLNGHYCASEGLVEPSGLCSAGYFCLTASDTPTPTANDERGSICPRGHYCIEGSVRPIGCNAGTHNPIIGQNQCFPCLAGYYCPENSTESDLPCPVGHYCIEGTAYATQYPCPIGHYNDLTERKDISDCNPCEAGLYCGATGLDAPSGLCDGGWYCSSESPSPQPSDPMFGAMCTPGFYCPEGSSVPLACLAGHFCNASGLSATSGLCSAGYYCNGSATVANPTASVTGDVCPCGHYCPVGSAVPLSCSEGTYSNATGNTNASGCALCEEGSYCPFSGHCEPFAACSEGYFCPRGQISSRPSAFICEPGHRCPEGSTQQIACEAGTYQDAFGQPDCSECPAGYFCDGNTFNSTACDFGVSVPLPCLPGRYCPVGTEFSDQFLCPLGTYSNSMFLTDVSQCTQCDPGFYCNSKGLVSPSAPCDAGYFCISGAVSSQPTDNVAGSICPTGSFCLEGVSFPTDCPVGTFNPSLGSFNASFCIDCTGGHYCDGLGMDATTGACSAGFFCTSRATTASSTDGVTGDLCPKGHACSEGASTPIPCSEGEYTNETHSSTCRVCPAGFQCPGSGTINPLVCPTGHYCLEGTGNSPFPCPGGTFNPYLGAAQLSECVLCTAGSYCETTALSSVTGLCDAGYYCPEGSETAASMARECPQGSYCPDGVSLPIECPPGTFSSALALEFVAECVQCTPGRFCEGHGLVAPTDDCSAGYFCTIGADSARPANLSANYGPCPIGHFCPPATQLPRPCPAGSHNPVEFQETCLSCPPGYYCPVGTSDFTLHPCPVGHYCLANTESATQYPCPLGSYNPSNSSRSLSACLPCPAGSYCGSEGLSMPSDACNSGYFCSGLAYTPNPSMVDFFTFIDSAILSLGNVSTGDICPEGSFCPRQSDTPNPCTPGFYCSGSGLSTVSDPCLPGYFCNGSSTEPHPVGQSYGDLCPPGTYCEEASSVPFPCPPATFAPHSGNENLTACLPCTAGSYCSSHGLSTPTTLCPSSVYCPAGQSTPTGISCPVGHFCMAGSDRPTPCPSGTYQPSVAQSSCEVCPARFYCDQYEAILMQSSGVNQTTHGVVMPSVCPEGFVCPAGTNSSNEHPCPSGSYSNQTGLESESQCSPCDAGYYCGEVGLTQPMEHCYAGSVCVLGSAIPNPDGSDSSGYPCPEGFYCLEGSTAPLPCPMGTFSNATQLTSIAECLPCTPGMYCITEGLASPTGSCFAGHFCTLGSVFPNPERESYGDNCTAGHYCLEGSNAPLACPPGTYQPFKGATSFDSCLSCDPGSFCQTAGQSSVSGNCSAGFYCESGASVSQPTDEVTGDICPIGHYCDSGSSFPVLCDPGTYSNSTGFAVCSICPEGYFCNDSITPEACPAGFYCPQGTGFDLQPCPAGTYNPSLGVVDVSSCLSCDPGKYCISSGLAMTTGICSAGFFCSLGVDVPNPSGDHTGEGGVCPPGSFCVEGSTSPTPCLAGFYNQFSGQSSCTLCPSGYYCPQNSSDFETNPCPGGHFCPAFTTHAFEFPCPTGTFNNQTLATSIDACLLCTPGEFCEGEGLSESTGNCSDGWFCVGGASNSRPISATNYSTDCVIQFTGGVCASGTYCPEGVASPLGCPMGLYCNDSGLSAPTGNCSAGYWCSGNAITPSPIDSPCPIGNYCEEGSQTPLPCPAGTFAPNSGNAEQSDCTLCTVGYYCREPGLSMEEGLCLGGYFCPTGSSEEAPNSSPCPVGHYCPVGSGQPLPCPPGSYQDGEMATDCKICTSGFFCNAFEINATTDVCSFRFNSTIGIVAPTVCPEGYYCPENTSSSTQYPCPEGTFSNQQNLHNISQCVSCSAGQYCQGVGFTIPTGNCSAGYVCVAGAISPTPNDGETGFLCLEGEYCTEGSSSGLNCPRGTYSNASGLSQASECLSCDAGSYCSSPGLTQPSGLCFAGHFCTGRAELPNPFNESYGDRCDPGQHCPAGSAFPEPCPIGTYSPFTGNDNVTDCVSCDPGKYCALPGQLNYTGECDAGYYCIREANSSRPTDGATGDICPEAHFCPTGSPLPTVCAVGMYMPSVGASECLECPLGLQCINGLVGFCTPGHYCPGGVGTTPLPCPVGTFSNLMNLTDVSECTSCPAGEFCESVGLTQPTGVCTAGFFCSSGVNTSEPAFGFTGIGGECTVGHYCPSGSGTPIPCEAGSYSNSTGQPECSVCPGGFFCLEATEDFIPNVCPRGHFCPEGTRYDTENPCPPGSYNNETGQTSLSACLPCPPGMYCDSTGLAEPTGLCSEGWYCTGGSRSPTPLSTSNTSLEIECFSPDANYTGGRCVAGSFCPQGSLYPIACTPGFYCDSPMLATPTGACSAGYYCPEGSASSEPAEFICPPGSFCVEMSATPSPCPIGTYSNESGLRNESECQSCTPGYYCNALGLTSPSAECNAGFFCPGGQSSPVPAEYICPLGHFCVVGSPSPQPCLPGFHQSVEGSASCTTCPEGNYCDPTELATCSFDFNGTEGVVIPTTCPKGHFCPNGTARSSEFPCPPGTFSNETGLAEVIECLHCTLGMYCEHPGISSPTGPCNQGYYCTEGASVPNPTDGVTGDSCDTGQYCPQGSPEGVNCPRGTFNNQTGLASEDECTPCSPGFFCDAEGLSEPTGPCLVGHFCSLHATYANPSNELFGDICSSGHYCPTQTALPIPCPHGTYLNQTRAESEEDCLPCEPGLFCNDSGLQFPVGPCSEGFFCTAGANSSTPLDGLTGDVCPMGSFCPGGSPLPIPCPDGSYANHTQASSCYICPERHFCIRRVAADPCPEGYYCPEGTGVDLQPCPIGTYNPVNLLAAEDECIQCDGGQYCAYPGRDRPLGNCSAGFYCNTGVNVAEPLLGNHTGEGGVCPISHFCPEGSSTPLPCPEGTYNNNTGASECVPCPPGYFCETNSSTFEHTPCPTGHYCLEGTRISTEFPCPPGTFNNLTGGQDLTSCVACSPGMYCEGYGNEIPTAECTEGWFCIQGSDSSTPISDFVFDFSDNCTCLDNITGGRCNPGTFCTSGSSFPSLCTAGMYCDSYQLSSPSRECFAGFYCEEGSDIPNQFPCPSGHYCPVGTAVPIPCPIGHFTPNTGTGNVNGCRLCSPGYFCGTEGLSAVEGLCSEGYYCPAGQNSSTPDEFTCPVGYFCPQNSSFPIACPSGNYQDDIAQPSCNLCPQGFYCDRFEDSQTCNTSGAGVIVPSVCPQGSYCPPGTEYASQFLCPEGTYSNASGLVNASDCTLCPVGHYCDSTGLTQPTGFCSAGYQCIRGSISPTPDDNITGIVCRVGHYCLEGSLSELPCFPGTYSNATGLSSGDQCTFCDPGKYCSEFGLVEPNGDCFSGYFCILGSSEPNPDAELYGSVCPSGHYCPEGTHTPVPCAPGFFLNSTGGETMSDCNPCTPGSYCEGNGLSEVSGDCSAGYFCFHGANTSTPTDGVSGDECAVGNYCPGGVALPRECVEGTYVNFTGAAECLECPSGFFCLVETVHPQLCPPGFFCPNGSGIDYISCPRGTFNPHFGLSSEEQCTPCTGGHFCGFENATEVSGACSAGYFCEGGVDTPTPTGAHRGSGGICPIAHFCPQQASVPNSCETGTYQDLTGQSACFDCPAGYFCLANSSAFLNTPCPPGYYCPSGTQHDTQFPCPAGTFNNASLAVEATDCTLCLPGTFCDRPGLTSPSGLCNEGYYCILGAASSRPVQLTLLNQTFDVCPPYSTNETGGICPRGFLCPEGSADPTPCTPGTYCPQEGLSQPLGNCSAGYYCPLQADTPTFIACSPGHYCPEGSAVETTCPPGTFSGHFLNTELSDCEPCTAGYYCEGFGLTIPTDECSSGYYCPGGQASFQPVGLSCGPGHFCESGSSNQTGCPAGQYQPNWGQSECLACPEAYYCDPIELSCTLDIDTTIACDANSTVDLLYISTRGVITPMFCPPGSYCPLGTEYSTQYLCPPGTYSNVYGLWEETQCISCSPRLYCDGEGLTEPSGLCSPGYFCNTGANTSTPTDGTTGDICPVGYFCEEGSIFNETPCPASTFNNLTGIARLSDCQNCTPGFYCPSPALSTPFGVCAAGHFCQSGSHVATPVGEEFGDLCPEGRYCLEGTATPLLCPEGSFLPATGKTL